MPTWLSDPPGKLYLILLIVGTLSLLAKFFLFGGLKKKRDSKQDKSSPGIYLLALALIAFLLALGLWVCDRMYESDREQIKRKLNEMSDGVKERNLSKTFSHVSESFRVGSAGKNELRAAGDRALQNGLVTEIPVWDIIVDPIAKEDMRTNARFMFKVRGAGMNEDAQYIGKSVWVREGAGEWRLHSFQIYLWPNERDSISVPGL